MKLRNLTLLAIAGLALSAPAWADSYTFNLNTWTGTGTPSETFVANGVSLTITGYIGTAPRNLYFKTSGGNETGIGIANLPDWEIGGTGFIQLDLVNVNANPGTLNFTLGSVQSNDVFTIYGSNTAGVEGTLLKTGTWADAQFALNNTAGYRYISIGSPTGTVLFDGLTVSTPEPGVGGLLVSGFMALIAAAAFFRRGVILGVRDGIA
jgi:hypothetical protein